jgi:hypothetical protein
MCPPPTRTFVAPSADAEEDAAVDALNDETFGEMGGDVRPLCLRHAPAAEQRDSPVTCSLRAVRQDGDGLSEAFKNIGKSATNSQWEVQGNTLFGESAASGRPDQATLNSWAGFGDANLAATFEAELAEARKKRGAQQFFVEPTDDADDANDDTFGDDAEPFRPGYEDEREYWNAPEVLAAPHAAEQSRFSRFVALEEQSQAPSAQQQVPPPQQQVPPPQQQQAMQQQMQQAMQMQAMQMQQQQQMQMQQMQQQMQQQQQQARQMQQQAQQKAAAEGKQQGKPGKLAKGWGAKPEAGAAGNLQDIMASQSQNPGPDLAQLQREQQARMDQMQREHVQQQQNMQRQFQGQMQQMQRQQRGPQQQQQVRRIQKRPQRPAQQVSAVPTKPTYTIKSGNPGMMTTREIESLIRQQHKSLMGDGNPYVDDYYHYATLCSKVLEKLGGGNDGSALPGIVPSQGGLAASLQANLSGRAGRTMPKHVANSLGKVAKWSADTPRELLKVPAPAVEAGATPASIPEDGAAEIDAPAIEVPAPSPRSSAKDPSFPLKVRSKIEAAWGLLYELEEFDRAEATAEDDPVREAERKVEAEKLLEALQLRGGADATSLPSPCSSTDDILLPNPGDEYFVAMCRLPKGRRLLRRAIPLLVPEFAQPVFSTVFRNIGVLQCTDDATRTAEDDDFFMTMAHSLVGLNVDADPNTHSVLMHAM